MKKYLLSFLVGVIGMISVLSCRTQGLALATLFLSAVAIGILAADRKKGFTTQTVLVTFIAIVGYTVGLVITVIFFP
jgi:NADH:ubiquinone oxidoreductase subunit K